MNRIKIFVRNFDFQNLFIEELGWNNPPRRQPVAVEVGRETHSLKMLSEKSGFQVFLHEAASADEIPDANTRKKFEKKLTEIAAEHLLIFTDTEKNKQIWQWARREPNMPLRTFTERFERGDDGERLAQKLEILKISIEDEERGLGGIAQIAGRVRTAFNVEPVVADFYKKFKVEHETFSASIDGITNEKTRGWYASLMLNRLMFSYFIQGKGFLDGDIGYLKNRLRKCQESFGTDVYFQFYRKFLLRLFHEGLGEGKQDSELVKLIGKVPYLNGGLFDIHEIERNNSEINIPDDAFERVFEFLDRYDWRLDDRPLRDKSEINPDVLGYVFEQYINKKQMGAYYTKEDITEYISKNTVLPFLLDKVLAENRTSFDKDEGIWTLLRENPDRYIYAAVRFGVIDETGAIVETPDEIVAGINNVDERGNWNRTAAARYGLPTETWREYWARRTRCLEIRRKTRAGEIFETNDLITYNLDIRQFVQDAIEQTESPDFVLEFYRAVAGRIKKGQAGKPDEFVNGVSILDPTCGSGAFLFAALNVLEPIVEACLARMIDFIEEADRSDAGQRHKPFRDVLQEIQRHTNREYFVLKSIVVNNLYGVDIMPEAVEICKLRLFLKLAAQVERDESKPNFGLEPLPDIDFNIRAGNTLVGFVDKASVNVCFDGADTAPRLGFAEVDSDKARFYDDVELAERAFEHFRLQQTRYGGKVTKPDKDNLREQLKKLSDKLDGFLACEYGVNTAKKADFAAWLTSHQPFHWLTEFYGIIAGGGFDVIIGNPPYVEYSKVKDDYIVKNFETLNCANLFAFMSERALKLANDKSYFGMIIPMSSISTAKMSDLRKFFNGSMQNAFFSHYSGDAHPSVLFNGVKMRLSIVIGQRKNKQETEKSFHTTSFLRWYSEAREQVFPLLKYTPYSSEVSLSDFVPKIDGSLASGILTKVFQQPKNLGYFVVPDDTHSVYAHRIVAHFIKSFDFIPYFKNDRDGEKKSEDYKVFSFRDKSSSLIASAFLNSTTFYYFYLTYSDAYHCGRELILSFPCDLSILAKSLANRLIELNKGLMKDFKSKSVRRKILYSGTGWIEYDEFYPKQSKPMIDEIDRVLAKHYGFTDEELDFIINYDIKYRMGREEAGDEK